MKTLGIDPSLTGLGWCIHDSSRFGSERVVARGVCSSPASELFVRRYINLRTELLGIMDAHPEIQNVGVESSVFGETFSEGAYGLFLYVNEALLEKRLDTVHFDPSTVKMLARMDGSIRRGAMRKQDMIEAAQADTTIRKWNHNEADAYIIARSAARFWEYLDGTLHTDELTPSEAQAFEGSGKGAKHRPNRRYFRFSKIDTPP